MFLTESLEFGERVSTDVAVVGSSEAVVRPERTWYFKICVPVPRQYLFYPYISISITNRIIIVSKQQRSSLTYILQERLEVVGNGIGSDLLHKRGVPKAGERVVGRGKQRELASALQGFDQPRAGNQSLESGVSCRIHNNINDGGRLFVLVWLAASSILDRSLVGAGLASWCAPRLERRQGSKTAQRLGAAQAEA